MSPRDTEFVFDEDDLPPGEDALDLWDGEEVEQEDDGWEEEPWSIMPPWFDNEWAPTQGL